MFLLGNSCKPLLNRRCFWREDNHAVPRKLELLEVDPLRDWILHHKNIGAYLNRARSALGWSLRELELRSGVTHTEIYKVEKCEQECRLSTFVRLSAALGLPWGRVFDDLARCNVGVFHRAVLADGGFREFANAHSISDDRLFDDVAMQVSAIVTLAAQLVRCDSALRKAQQVWYPDRDFERGFVDYATRLDNTDVLTARLEILAGFNRAPLRELQRQSLWFDGFIVRYLDYLRLPPGTRPKPSPFWTSRDDLLSFPDFTEAAAQKQNTNKLYNESRAADKNDVKSEAARWPKLREQTQALTAEHGAKARLADAFGVSRQVLNGWLSGASAPDAETTLRLLAWVTAEEAKQTKSPTGVRAPAEPKTQPRSESKNENQTKSGR